MKAAPILTLTMLMMPACRPPHPEDLTPIGKVVITNRSSRPVAVLRLEIGRSVLQRTVTPGTSSESAFVCASRSAHPTECRIRWQIQDPEEEPVDTAVDLRHLNAEPMLGYELVLGASFSWSANRIPVP